MQFTDTVDSAAAPDCQIGHIERLRRILTISPAQRQKVLERNRKVFFGILLEVTFDQARREAVKACFYGSVGRKKVAGTGDGERDIKWLIVIFHVGAGSFEHRESGVTFIEMANFGLQSECPQKSPASNAKDQLLLQTQLRTAAVKFSRNAAIGRRVCGIVGIQQIQFRSADLHLPGSNPQLESQVKEAPAEAIHHLAPAPA